MKLVLYIIFLSTVFTSCTVTNFKDISYENSNASLIQKSIVDLGAVDELKSKLSSDDKIVIVGLEDYKTSDYSMLVTIEDELIKAFVNNNYNILERDNDMLFRLFSEESQKFKNVNRLKKQSFASSSQVSNSIYRSNSNLRSNTNVNGYSSTSRTSGNSNSGFNSNSSSASNFSDIKNYDQIFQSKLDAADKILSYRVIECGIIYDYNSKDASYDEIERQARTILEVRLTNAKTSEIIHATTLDGSASDIIKESEKKELKDFSYNYYSHTLPKVYGTTQEKNQNISKGKNPKTFLGIMGGLFAIMIISALIN